MPYELAGLDALCRVTRENYVNPVLRLLPPRTSYQTPRGASLRKLATALDAILSQSRSSNMWTVARHSELAGL